MSITFKVEAPQLKGMKRRMAQLQKQMPFATSLALNQTGKDIQTAEIANVKRVFKNKKTWWLPKQPTGIKMRRSTKRFLRTTILTNAPFIKLHEFGGIKRPHTGRSIAIPSDNVPKTLRKAGSARKFRGRKTSFVVTLRDGDRAILRRKGSKKNKRNELFFFLEKQAKIKPRLGFRPLAKKVAVRQFPRHMKVSIVKAMNTARR